MSALPEDVLLLLDDIARNDDLVFGLGQTLEEMRPCRASGVLRAAYRTDTELRASLVAVIRDAQHGSSEQYGAIVLFKKLGADDVSATELLPALMQLLLHAEPVDSLFTAAWSLAGYCVQAGARPIPPIAAAIDARVREFATRPELARFASLAARGFPGGPTP